MSIYIGFEWRKDRAGYRRLPAGRTKTILLGADGKKPERIAPQFYDWENYRPLEEYPNLYLEFAKIKPTYQSVLYFIQRFGSLTKKGLTDEGDDVEAVIREAEKMRKFIEDYKKGGQEAIISLVGAETAKMRGMECIISVDPSNSHLRVQLLPDCLLTALWLQMFRSLPNLEKIRSCRLCQKWFEVGSGTGRRFDAQFCTQEHKIKFFSKQRTLKKRRK